MKKRLLSLAMALAMCLSLLPTSVFAADSGVVPINKDTFPDDNFRAYVQTLPGAENNEFTADELAAIKQIHISGSDLPEGEEITTLKGIEFFHALRELSCNNTSITELDVSQNLCLENLYCPSNQLTTLKLGYLQSLNVLVCSKNRLTTLELGSLPALAFLDCAHNQLTELTLSGVPALKYLYCSYNELNTLSFGHVPELSHLDCAHNHLIALKLVDFSKLELLYCQDNELAALDLSCNPELQYLESGNNGRFVTDSTTLSQLDNLDPGMVTDVRGGSFDGVKINFTGDHIAYDYNTGWKSSYGYVNPILTFLMMRSFTDVPETSWYTYPVHWAVKRNVTSGVTTTEFGPTDPCNRAQIVTFLWKMAGTPAPTSTENPFTDVPEDAWYTSAVLWAVEKGITKGMTETTFGPTEICNRAQAMTFLWKCIKEPDATEELPFTDVKEGAWYENAVRWAVENGVTKGMSETEFGTATPCNRAQTVTFLYKTDRLPV